MCWRLGRNWDLGRDWIPTVLISSMARSAVSWVQNLKSYWKGYGNLMGRTLLRGVYKRKYYFGDDIMSFLTLPCFLTSTYRLHAFFFQVSCDSLLTVALEIRKSANQGLKSQKSWTKINYPIFLLLYKWSHF